MSFRYRKQSICIELSSSTTFLTNWTLTQENVEMMPGAFTFFMCAAHKEHQSKENQCIESYELSSFYSVSRRRRLSSEDPSQWLLWNGPFLQDSKKERKQSSRVIRRLQSQPTCRHPAWRAAEGHLVKTKKKHLITLTCLPHTFHFIPVEVSGCGPSWNNYTGVTVCSLSWLPTLSSIYVPLFTTINTQEPESILSSIIYKIQSNFDSRLNSKLNWVNLHFFIH